MQSLRERFTCHILVYHQCKALGVSIKEIIFMIFFSGGSGVLLEVNSGGGGWNLFFLLVGGGVLK